MATTPDRSEPTLNISEQLARIDQIQVDLGHKLAMTAKTCQGTRFGPLSPTFAGMGALAAFAAGVVFAKVFLG
ncbi:hypothetical protein [Sphingomonas bacterium]|uniref:hypothetical protein n=1 Tax=Sphingomonas bacterium TaxID=1895847 RepID=UPI001576627D|nr:hypothetical protein [Sphingomonas bacterium]